MALTKLRHKPILAFTEESDAAQLATLHYEAIRDAVLEERAWTFATKRYILVPEVTPVNTDAQFGYSHTFVKPGECLRIFWASDDPDTERPNTLDWVREGDRILANTEKLYARGAISISDTTRFSPTFVQALVDRIAMEFAPALVEDPGMYDRYARMYTAKIQGASAMDATQGRAKKIRTAMLDTVRRQTGLMPYG